MDNEPEVQQEVISKDLVFKEYESIELSTRDKVIKAIRDQGFDNPHIEWVASEKIHGSNFSIHCSGDKIRYGRRTDFLSDDINIQCPDVSTFFKESFYDARNLVNTFHNKIGNINKKLKEIYPEMIKFGIYGEYFGGSYPGKESPVKAVQKGVNYVPQHEFIVFDIRIFTEKSTFWVDVSDLPKCLEDNLKSVPIYARGTFDEMFAINTKIDSTIPELYGLPKLNDNIIEGFVIRPNHSINFSSGDKVILKKKNQEFDEKAKAPVNPKIKEKVEKQVDPELVPYLEVLQAYLNVNRIESVVSKYPDQKNRKILKEEVIKDIMSDAAKDEFKEPEPVLNKKLKQEFDGLVLKALTEYFAHH